MHICTNLLLSPPKENDSWVSLSKVILFNSAFSDARATTEVANPIWVSGGRTVFSL